jgi:hypothetical protein
VTKDAEPNGLSDPTERSIVPPSAHKHTVRPWFLFPLEALPIPVPYSAAIISALLFTAGFLLQPTTEPPPGVDPERMLMVICVFIGCSIGLTWLGIRASREALVALRPLLSCSNDQFDALEVAATKQRASAMIFAALLGFGISVAIGYFRFSATAWAGSGIFILMGALQWILAVSASWILLSIALVFRRVGANLPRIDLFQLDSLAPFQRLGLRLSLLLFGLFAIRFVLVARPGTFGYLAITSVGAMILGTALLLLPLWGAHRRIVAEKQRELAAVRERIASKRDRDPPESSAVSRELLDLLEYKERVASTPDWPLDVPAVLRFALYLTIPVLGWVGGAAMERLLDLFASP